MADTRNLIKRTIEDCLAADGWRKKSASWYKPQPELLLAVNLQKSDHAQLYYLNLAIWIGVPDCPPYYQADIGFRVDKVPGADQYNPDRLLNLESDLPDGLRETALRMLMRECILPQINKADTVSSLEPGGAVREIINALPLLSVEAKFLKTGKNAIDQ